MLFSLTSPLLAMDVSPSAPSSWVWILAAILFFSLLACAYTDLFVGRLVPNWAGWLGIGGGFMLVPILFTQWQVHLALGAVVLVLFGVGGVLGAVGLGDVKIYTALALLLGPLGLWVILVAHFLALVIAGGLMLIRRRRFPIPMIPFVLIAFLSAMWSAGTPTLVPIVTTAMSVLVMCVGLLRSRIRPIPRITDIVAPHLMAPGTSVRVTPLVAYCVGADGIVTTTSAPSEMRLSAAIAISLTHEELAQLDSSGHFVVPAAVGGVVVDVTIWSVGRGYLLEAASPLDHGRDLRSSLPAPSGTI